MISNEIATSASFRENIEYNLYGNKSELKRETAGSTPEVRETSLTSEPEGTSAASMSQKSAWYVARNLITDDLEAATRIMEATAAPSRAKKCAYHFSIDWHVDEEKDLTPERAIAAADDILERLELENHQALYFWHTDADHPHMHVVVNRVDEQSLKAHDMWKSKEKLERATHEVAREMGFMEVAGRHNDLPFEPNKTKGAPQTKEERIHTDDLKPWVKEDIQGIKDKFRASLHDSWNWTELNASLAAQGLEIRTKGQGLIITDGTHFTQFSKMGKDVRHKGKFGLEQKFKISFEDHQELERNQALSNEERMAEWAAGIDKVADDQTNTREVDARLYDLMEAMDRLGDFEKRLVVQKSAATVMWTQEKIRFQEKLLKHARTILESHNTKFNEMLVEIYQDPEEAEKAVRDLYSQNQLQEAVRASGVKKERWKVIIDKIIGKQREVAKKLGKKNSERRKQADRFEKMLFYRLQKIREAENRITERRRQVVQAKFDCRAKKKEHKKNLEQRESLQNLKDAATRQTTKDLIYNSELPWKERVKMLNTWDALQEKDKNKDKEQEQELDQDRSREQNDGMDR